MRKERPPSTFPPAGNRKRLYSADLLGEHRRLGGELLALFRFSRIGSARADQPREWTTVRITLLGHAALLVEVDGATCLMDPVFFDPFEEGTVVSCPR